MSILGAPLVQFVIKAGTTGAAIMAGSRIVGEGVQAVAGIVDDLQLVKPKIVPLIAGPLDTLTTVLDPLDITGTRRRKEQQAKERQRAQKRKAAREAKKRKAAEKAASQAEATAADAERRAQEAEARAQEAERRANDAEAAKKRAEASRQMNWAKMARRTATQARQESVKAPDMGAELAKLALDMAKTALKPPEKPTDAFAPGMTPQAQSLAAQIVDEMNRRESEPDFDGLLSQFMSGDAQAAQLGLLGHAGVYGPVSGLDDDDDDVAGDDDDDDDVAGDDDDDAYDVSGPDKKPKAKKLAGKAAKGEGLGANDLDEPAPFVAGCCEACATSGTSCAGLRVPEHMIDGSVMGDDDDDVSGDDDDIAGAMMIGEDDDPLIEGDDGSDDFIISGPRYRTHGPMYPK